MKKSSFFEKKIIFDFGSNNGQNINYFLQKAEIVVCVEANPVLTEKIKNNFSAHVKEQFLFVENIGLSSIEGSQDFYIHKKYDLLSTLAPPKNDKDFKKIIIPVTTPSNIIKKYLSKMSIQEIEYIKIDLEHYDHIILKDLFKNNIFPKYISAELQDTKVINLILNSPYKSFKFLENNKVGREIKTIQFKNYKGEMKTTNFIEHTSGPYGDDIPGKYYTKNSIITYLINNGLGWKDICCSLKFEEYNQEIVYDEFVHFFSNSSFKHHLSGFEHHLKELYPSFKRMLKKRINNIIKK